MYKGKNYNKRCDEYVDEGFSSLRTCRKKAVYGVLSVMKWANGELAFPDAEPAIFLCPGHVKPIFNEYPNKLVKL